MCSYEQEKGMLALKKLSSVESGDQCQLMQESPRLYHPPSKTDSDIGGKGAKDQGEREEWLQEQERLEKGGSPGCFAELGSA